MRRSPGAGGAVAAGRFQRRHAAAAARGRGGVRSRGAQVVPAAGLAAGRALGRPSRIRQARPRAERRVARSSRCADGSPRASPAPRSFRVGSPAARNASCRPSTACGAARGAPAAREAERFSRCPARPSTRPERRREPKSDRKHTRAVTFRDRIGGRAGDAGRFEDGPSLRIAVPGGEGRPRIEERIDSFAAALRRRCLAVKCGGPGLAFVKRKRFELLDAGGCLDFAGGGWDRGRNRRRARRGRYAAPVAAGQGSACNGFLSGGCRVAARCRCLGCGARFAADRRCGESSPGPGRRCAVHSPVLAASIFPPANGSGAQKAPLNG